MDISGMATHDDNFEPPDVDDAVSPLPDVVMLKQQA